MKKIYKFLVILLFVASLVGCSNDQKGENNPNINENENKNPDDGTTDKTEDNNYYTYDSEDNLLMMGNNVWTCIIKARDNSKSSNKCYVTDGEGNVVYKYSSSTYYYYRSNTYCGSTKDKDEAIKWAMQFNDSYVIDGKAGEMIYVGKSIQTNNKKLHKDFVKGILQASSTRI